MKLSILKSVFLIIFTVLITSCSNDDDSKSDFEFQGVWSGTYTGDDEGVWAVTVNSSGVATGTATSNFTSDTYTVSGNVDSEGGFLATIGSASTGTTFSGTMATDETASGTWENTYTNKSGIWLGAKQ